MPANTEESVGSARTRPANAGSAGIAPSLPPIGPDGPLAAEASSGLMPSVAHAAVARLPVGIGPSSRGRPPIDSSAVGVGVAGRALTAGGGAGGVVRETRGEVVWTSVSASAAGAAVTGGGAETGDGDGDGACAACAARNCGGGGTAASVWLIDGGLTVSFFGGIGGAFVGVFCCTPIGGVFAPGGGGIDAGGAAR